MIKRLLLFIAILAVPVLAGVSLAEESDSPPTGNIVLPAIDPEDTYTTANGNISESVYTPTYAIALTKTASSSFLWRTGDEVTYTYEVQNNCSDQSVITGVVLNDDKIGTLTPVENGNGDAVLDPGETWRYTATVSLAYTTTNSATVTGTAADGSTVSATAQATVEVGTINLSKTCSPASLLTPGPVVYTYLVSNPMSEKRLYHITLTDDRIPAEKINITDKGNGDDILDPGESWTYTSDSIVLNETTVNTASVSGYIDNEMPVLSAVICTVVVETGTPGGPEPAITIDKTANPTSLSDPGTVAYTYEVHGNVDLTDITVTDDKLGTLSSPSGDTDSDGILDVGETWKYTASATVSATTTNVATARGRVAVKGEPTTLTSQETPVYPVWVEDTDSVTVEVKKRHHHGGGGGGSSQTTSKPSEPAEEPSREEVKVSPPAPKTIPYADAKAQETAPVEVSVPMLPSTGVDPDDSIALWSVTIGLLITVLFMFVVRKKRKHFFGA